jgi:hypothetical protein
MKASLNAAAPSKVLPAHLCGLGISQKQKMQIAPDELLKTKGQKKVLWMSS